MRSFRTSLLTLAALGVALAACSSARTVRIGTLLEDPGRYEGRAVRVEGEVTESAGALGYGAYQVDDGTGRIYVVTTRGGAPAEGARVGVEGTFRALYTFGSHSGVAIQEDRRYRP
jgi:hypothetical protein